jgi:hypothetical protein
MNRSTVIYSITLVLSVAAVTWAHAQDEESTAASDSRVNVDFAVPDAPAFELLKVDAGKILRPSTVREISAAATDLVGDGGRFELPRTFGIEFSPGLLFFGRNVTLSEYQDNPALYRFRLSVATHRPEDSQTPNNVAFGARLSLLDESDLRTNEAAIDSILTILNRQIDLDAQCEIVIDAEGNPSEPSCPADVESQLDQLSEQLKQLYADTMWNKTALDVAVATRVSTAERDGRNPEVAEATAWVTYALATSGLPLLGDFAGQLLIGLRGGAVQDPVLDDAGDESDWNAQGSLAARYYLGSNRHKVYLDAQATAIHGSQWGSAVAAGGEFRLLEAIWTNVSVDWFLRDTEGSGDRLVAKLTFKAAAPR